MAPPVFKEYTEDHGEPVCLELQIYRSPQDRGKLCAMMQGCRVGNPNPGYGDVVASFAPYPIQKIDSRDDAIKLATEIAERDGYPVVLVKDDTRRAE